MAKLNQLRVTEGNAASLLKTCEIGRDKLTEAKKVFQSYGDNVITVPDLIKKLNKHEISRSSSTQLITQALSLKRLQLQKNATTDELFDALAKGLEGHGDENLRSKFSDTRDILKDIVDQPATATLVKSYSLYHDHAAVVTDSRVYTEVRPLFDETRDTVIGASVYNRLKIEYDTLDDTKFLEVVLRPPELKALAEELERATKKTNVIGELFKDRLGIEPRVFTDESDLDGED